MNSLKIVVLLMFMWEGLLSQQVSICPQLSTLGDRWSWAAEHAPAGNIWVGYSIDRMMEEDSWIGSISSDRGTGGESLYELVTGRHMEADENGQPEPLRRAAERALAKAEGTYVPVMVKKEVAFLFRFPGSELDPEQLQRVKTTDISLAVDLEHTPLVWMGKVSSEESLDHLISLFANGKEARAQKRIVSAIGLHGPSGRVFSFLTGVAKSDAPDEVREDAVFWISQQHTKEALEFLVGLTNGEESKKILERAVFGISQVRLEEATDVLIRLGRESKNTEVRKKAVFWLGQRASKKALAALKAAAYDDRNEDVQKQAIFALGQTKDGGVEEMIRIAKEHGNPRIRKQAIFWLGQSDDPRAFDAIVEIATEK